MKKMIMFACVALAAAFVNAASVEWSVSGLQAADEKTPADYSYIFLCDTTEADITAALADGSLTGGVAATSKTVRGSTTWSAAGAATTTAGVGDSVTGYLVVLDSASEMYAIQSKVSAVAESTGKAVFSFSAAGTTPSTPTGHGGGGDGVPEPTSGLLLLVGGAMLALRRKQK